jgi:Cd2+/Zn2+-exporting ATPase
MATIKAIAFDKTGTITTGLPAVTDVIPYGTISRNDLISLTVSIESRSEHPIAQAVVNYALTQEIKPDAVDNFEAVPGLGVRGTVGGQRVLVGTERLMESAALKIPDKMAEERARLENEGKTVLAAHAETAGWLGVIAVADELRPGAAGVITSLRDAGIERIVILTGDNERVASAIAKRVGADEVRANLLPEEKVEAVKVHSDGWRWCKRRACARQRYHRDRDGRSRNRCRPRNRRCGAHG